MNKHIPFIILTLIPLWKPLDAGRDKIPIQPVHMDTLPKIKPKTDSVIANTVKEEKKSDSLFEVQLKLQEEIAAKMDTSKKKDTVTFSANKPITLKKQTMLKKLINKIKNVFKKKKPKIKPAAPKDAELNK